MRHHHEDAGTRAAESIGAVPDGAVLHGVVPDPDAGAALGLPDVRAAWGRRPAVGARTCAHLRAVGRHVRGGVDRGMATAEYAIATLAAVGFAGLLVVILKGNQVRGLLMGIIERALGQ